MDRDHMEYLLYNSSQNLHMESVEKLLQILKFVIGLNGM